MPQTATKNNSEPPARSERATAEPRAGGPKLYGSLVGTPSQSNPPRPADKAYANTINAVMVRDKIVLAAAPTGTVISLGLFGWETTLDFFCQLFHTALGAGVAASLGDVTFPAAYLNGVDFSALANASFFAINAPLMLWLPLWQQLGYADLPTAQRVGLKCELLLTLTGGTATGTVAWLIQGEPRV